MEVHRRPALVVFALFAGLLFGAAPASAVSNVTVDNSSPSNGAGARTKYVVTFVTGGALAPGGTVSVTFPAGTTFANYNGGGVFDGATRKGNCPSPGVGSLVITCNIFNTIDAGRTARVEFNGITNPTTPSNTPQVT